jgi:hypothetical protein
MVHPKVLEGRPRPLKSAAMCRGETKRIQLSESSGLSKARLPVATTAAAAVPKAVSTPPDIPPAPFASLPLASIGDEDISELRTGPVTVLIGSWSAQHAQLPAAKQFLHQHLAKDAVVVTGADYKRGDDTPLIYLMAAEAGRTNKVVAISHPKNLTADDRALPSNTYAVLSSGRDGWGGGTLHKPVGATAVALEMLRTSLLPKVVVLGGGPVAAEEVAIYHNALCKHPTFELVGLDLPRRNGGSCLGVLAASELGYRVHKTDSVVPASLKTSSITGGCN